MKSPLETFFKDHVAFSAFNKAMLYDTFNWDEVTDHVITGNYGVDFSTLIKKLEKGDL